MSESSCSAIPTWGPPRAKYSPQIVAGSYIGWLEAILRHLTARYKSGGASDSFSDADALEAVYNYASHLPRSLSPRNGRPTSPRSATTIPSTSPRRSSNQPEDKDLTSEEGVRDALTYETTTDDQGEIAYVWGEYLAGAFDVGSIRSTRARSSSTWPSTSLKSVTGIRSAKT